MYPPLTLLVSGACEEVSLRCREESKVRIQEPGSSIYKAEREKWISPYPLLKEGLAKRAAGEPLPQAALALAFKRLPAQRSHVADGSGDGR